MSIANVVRKARDMFNSDEARPSSLLPQMRHQLLGARDKYHAEIARIVADTASWKDPSTGESWGNLQEIGSDDPQALAEFLASPAITQHQVRFSGAPEYREQWETEESGGQLFHRKIRVIAR